MFGLIAGQVYAVPASPEPADLDQPDGNKVSIHLRGDEFFSWNEDSEGYVIKKDPKDKFWKYARPKAGSLEFEVIPGAVVGKSNPETLNLKKGDLPDRVILKDHINKQREPQIKELTDPDSSTSSASPSSDGEEVSSADEPPPQFIPVSGTKTVKNVVILACFNDHWDSVNNNVLSSKGRTNVTEYDNLFNQIGHTSDSAVGSVKDYYRENSYGKLTVDSVVSVWVKLPENEAFYGAGNPDSNPRQMVVDAIAAADAAGFDFSQADGDGDGWIDGLTIIHSGHGQEYSGNPSDCIWSHKWSLSSTVTYDGVKMKTYHTSPALRGSASTSTSIIRIGVICHEMGHFFGLPDLYDYAGTYSSISVGNWCEMSGGSWGGGDGRRPTHFSAWCKQALGFVTPVLVHSQTTLTVPDVTYSDTIYMIRDGASNGEYFLVENRNRTGFDASTPGRGIMIWHVDPKSGNNTSTDWPHPLVKMEDADGDTVANETASAWYSGNGGMLTGGFRDQTGNLNTSAMRYQSSHYAQRTDNLADYTYIRLNNFSAQGANMTVDVSTLIPTVATQLVDTADYTVNWSSSSDATKYEIQEGEAITTTSFTDSFEDEDTVHDNWALAGCILSSGGARTGTKSMYFSAYHDGEYWNSVQTLFSRNTYRFTENTTVQFYFMSKKSAGVGQFKILASNDGANWQTLWTHNGGSVDPWAAVNITTADLTSAGFSAGDDLSFKFTMDYEDWGGWSTYPGHGWAIDDFSVINTEIPDYTNWTALSSTVAAPSYDITGKSNGSYGYRVRGYSNGAWQRLSPSATVTVNIAGPEMDVTRSDSPIADGGTDSVTGTEAAVGTQLTYTISNQGGSDLTLTTPVTATAVSSCLVNVDTQPSSSVAAAASTELILTVTPAANGAWSATVSIDNNDADENPYNWTLSGTATTYYTVTLDQQGGSGGDTSVSAGYNLPMPEATAPTRAGYSFGGYYTVIDGGGTQYYTDTMASARDWDIEADTTLYASWSLLPPDAPTNLAASASIGQVDLSWSAVSNTTSYNVKRSTVSGGGYETVASPVGGDAINYNDTVANGNMYYYVVTAVNAAGESGNSDEVESVLPHILPFAETFDTLNLADLSGQNLWSATNAVVQTNVVFAGIQAGAITSEDGFVEQTFAGSETNVWTDFQVQPVFFEGDFDPSAMDGTAIFYFNTNGYPVAYDGTNNVVTGTVAVTSGDWVRITVNSDYAAQTWDLYINGSPVRAGLGFYDETTTHYQRFKVSGGSADRGSLDDIEIGTSSPLGALFIEAPTGLSAAAIDSGQVNLSWTDNSTNETGFAIERSLTSSSGFAEIGAASEDITSYSDTSVDPNTTYHYRVVATNASSSSAASEEALATTPKAPATVTLADLSQIYDGTAREASYTTDPSNLTANVTYDGNAWAPTNAGNYEVVATIDDETYAGSTTGTLVVAKATPTATLHITNTPQTYDGNAKSATVEIQTSSVAGAVANVANGTHTNAGTYAVTADFVPTDTDNYETLTGLAAGDFVIEKATPSATLHITNTPQTYDGTAKTATVEIQTNSVDGAVANVANGTHTNAGTYAVTADFVPIDTDNYETLSGLSAGDFVIEKVSLTITAASDSKVYDGTALTNSGYDITSGSLAIGDSLDSVTVIGSQTAIGSSSNVPSAAVITDGSSADVTASYDITYANGTLTVTDKPPLTITAASDTKVYDGTALTTNGYSITSGSLEDGHTLVSVNVAGSQTIAGNSDNVPSSALIQDGASNDVTASYEITYANGTLEVTPRAITITASDDTKEYDGTALTNAGYGITSGSLATGDSLDSVTVTGSQTTAGSSANTPSAAAITDGSSADVTSSYNITYAAGTLTVTQATPEVSEWPTASPIMLTQALSASTLTNGTALVGGDFDFTNPDTVPDTAGTNSADVTFTPTDTTNYTTVAGTVDVLVEEAVTIPFAETFEALTLGDLNGQNAWQATGVVVQTNVVQEGTNAAEIVEGEGYLQRDFSDAQTNVWTDFRLQPVFFDGEPSGLGTDATTVFYINNTGNPVVYNGTTNEVISNVTVTAGQWIRVTVQSDYVARKWNLYIDETLKAKNLDFYGDTTTHYTTFKVSGAGASSAYLDDIQIGTNSPLGALFIEAPSGLSAAAIDSGQVDLSWTDNSTNETGFAIERSLTSGSGFGEIGAAAEYTTSYSDTSVDPNTTYYYRVVATNASSSSAASEEALATTLKATATVTFDANGGTDPAPSSKTVSVDAPYGELATTRREGHTQDGWFTAAEGGARVTSNTVVTATSNHTLYAQWATNDYSFIVISEHGTPNPSGTNAYAYGTLVVFAMTDSPVELIPTNTQVEATGWVSTGSLESKATGTNSTFTITNDTTMTWQWSTNYWINLGTVGE